MEEQLRERAAREAGRMAAVIAHEVKNRWQGYAGNTGPERQMAGRPDSSSAEGDRLPDRCARPDDERSVAVRAAAEATLLPISSRS